MAMTLSDIDAEIAALEAVRRARLMGTQIAETAYAGRSVKFSAASIEEIGAEIARLKIERARLVGCASGLGPVRIGFGSR